MADLSKLSDAELLALYQRMRTPSARRGEDPAERMAKAPDNPVEVALIGAGRQGDKLVSGLGELGLGVNVAAREAMGMQSDDQLRKMAAMEEMQRANDAAYQPLREKHPFLTGTGEAAFLAGAPMGQATAAGRVAAPVVTSVVNELLSYGSPKERFQNAGEKGSMALAGGVAGEGVRTLIAPAKSALSAPQQTAVQQAAERIGYKPRASELTGSETLRRLEDAVARQPGGAGPMRDLIEQNRSAVNRTLAGAMGEDAEKITPDVFASASERIGKEYNTLRARATMPVGDDVFAAVKRAETMLGKGDKTGAKKEAADMIQRLKDEMYEAKEFDGATYQAWTSDLGARARELGKTNRTAAAALREVEKEMDRVARGADAKKWRETDMQNAAMEMLMKPRVVNEATGDASLAHLASKMEQQFGKNLKTGKIQGPLVDAAMLGRALPPMREGSQTAGREAFAGAPGWLMAAPNYAIAKGLSSELGRNYLSTGLLGNAGLSSGIGGFLGRGSIPLSIAEIEMLLRQ